MIILITTITVIKWMNEQGFESNTENRHRKRRATQPCNSKIVDFGSYGYPTAMNYYFREKNGKLYTTGYQPNNKHICSL